MNEYSYDVGSEPFMYISDKDTEEFASAVNEDGFFDYLQKQKDKWKNTPLNIAVTGMSAVGKSSFINAMLGLKADEKGAAPVGLGDITRNVTGYRHPNNSNIIFWDLPGVGTLSFPRVTYLEDIHFNRYDSFIILTATAFNEDEAWLGKEVQKQNKTVYYVRTKIWSDVTNDQAGRGGAAAFNIDGVLKSMRNKLEENLKRLNIKAQVFLADSHHIAEYDFPALAYAIIRDFDSEKQRAMSLTLNPLNKKMIKIKIAELRYRAWRMAAMSAATSAAVNYVLPGLSGFIIAAGTDMGILYEEVTLYWEQLGLFTGNSLSRCDDALKYTLLISNIWMRSSADTFRTGRSPKAYWKQSSRILLVKSGHK